jgi:hypothetical protein
MVTRKIAAFWRPVYSFWPFFLGPAAAPPADALVFAIFYSSGAFFFYFYII